MSFSVTKPFIASALVAGVLYQCNANAGLFRFLLGGSPSSSYVHKSRQSVPAAETAEEWAERVKLDSQNFVNLENLYAELPPIEQWDKAFDLAQKHIKPHHSKEFSIFHLLLQQKDAEALKLLKDHVKSATHISDYQKKDLLVALYSLSNDTDATKQWVKDNKPELFEYTDSSYNSEESPKEPWEIALANNEVDKGLKLLWAKIDITKANEQPDLLSKVLKIAELTDRPNDLHKAAAKLEKLSTQKIKDGYLSFYDFRPWVQHCAKHKQWDKINVYIAFQIKQKDNEHNKKQYEQLQLWVDAHTLNSDQLITRIEQYTEKHELSTSAIYDILGEKYDESGALGLLYSKALKAAGKDDAAWAVAAHTLALSMGDDTSYQYALSLDPKKFRALLNQLHKFDPFEERPLIWQAKLALTDGNLDLARKHIDAAIALDPSDGDQGKNSRMHAYAVLADIYLAQGNTEKAEFFNEVTKSIRSGEAADDYLYAGLIEEAIKRYQKSLGHFNDAYCLQSRLALTLARSGRFEEAIPHFEKAFNLMPVSFGPRESHCFGCEGLFSDKRVHPIAERILKAFVDKNPDNPRAPYLLGLVYKEMENDAAAVQAFQTALNMDPRYYNASEKLIDLLEKDPTNTRKVQQLVKQATQFAPYASLQRLFEKRSDLRQAWIDAQAHTSVPLDLGKLPLTPPAKLQLYTERDSWNYNNAIDGWTRDELLRENDLLDAIDSLP